MLLDVGCGANPRGDVNCDLHPEATTHRNNNSTIKAQNFIQCDCQHLPFKDKSFDTVFCAQLIEHLREPYQLIKELARVAIKRIIIETVHYMGEAADWQARKWYRQHHVSKFTRGWFSKAATAVGWRLENSEIMHYKHFPHEYLALFRFPYGIHMELTRRD